VAAYIEEPFFYKFMGDCDVAFFGAAG